MKVMNNDFKVKSDEFDLSSTSDAIGSENRGLVNLTYSQRRKYVSTYTETKEGSLLCQ